MKRYEANLNDGNRMPVLGLGTWQLTGQACIESVRMALAIGYRHIDTAAVYANEAQVAQGIAASTVLRQDIFITTKIKPSAKDPAQAVLERLDQLDTDYLDLCLIHWPPETGYGQALWRSLETAQTDGLIRSIGVSNYTVPLLRQLLAAADVKPAVNQIELSPFQQQEQLVAFCQATGIVVQAYSPLTQQKQLGNSTLGELAKLYGKTPAQILLRWCLDKQTVPLPKASSEQHLRENFEVFDFKLSPSDVAKLDALEQAV